MKRLVIVLFAAFSAVCIQAQISSPASSTSFSTNYTSGFLSSGGQNDVVYVFCSDQNNSNVGELQVAASGCTVVWYYYDGFSYSELGQTGNVATGLSSGLYMAQVDCSGTVSCYRAWVWVNQTFVNINPIEPGCETFTLSAQASVLDNSFLINDPPGLNFEIDANTYIQVCFWADHTYVSDLGFYLKAPGESATEPNNNGVVALLPAASDWGTGGAFLSNTTIPWTVTGCDAADENVPCNDGNGVEEFCFSTNYWLGGPELTPANPAQVPCVCDLPTPLTGMWAPAESWSRIYGYMAGDPGWAVQIYDCEQIDFGTLNMARLVFSANTDCGQTTFLYDSGEISSTINDNSCAASTASIYVVPPSEPAGEYTVTSSITDYSWSCTGSGFTGNQLSHQIVQGTGDFPQNTSDFILTVTETISAPGSPQCEVIDSETFYTLPSDATITPVTPVCANSTPFQLQAADGGGTWTTNAPAGTIVNNVFYPGIAGGGNWNVGYEIDGPCPDDDQITITVYETISIEDFSDNVCDGLGENYTVSFNVVNNQGNPATFIVDYGSGQSSPTGSFSHSFPSQTSYSITVTDTHSCDEYILNGYRDCGCTTFAGTLSSTTPIQLCVGECTESLSHNNNEILDGNDILEFIIHDGSVPPNIFAYNPTEPEFCLNDIPGGTAGTVYYIAAIAGNNSGGHVQTGDPCYSQSISTAVIWYDNPIAHIAPTTISVCGLTADLVANETDAGEIGTWTASGVFLPAGGQTVNDNELTVIKNPPYGSLVFTWTVVNNICSASDNVTVNFNEQPNAYAGEDIEVCGNETELAAVLSLPTSSGFWSGNGSFEMQSDPETSVTSSGTQVFTWREENGSCWDEDFVTVTFVQTPQPTTSPNVDTVCGVVYNLNVYNVTGTGYWTAYEDGVPFSPAPLYMSGISSPTTQVIVAYGTDLSVAVDFVWTESLNAGSLVCSNTTTKRVVFSRQPVASVGLDEAEICGNCYQFDADTVGSGWAQGFWIAKDIILESYDDLTKPDANICIDPNSSYGDTAHVEVEFLWVMKNTGCVSIDTMWVTFYQRPQANAGLDGAVCGNNYELGAVYDLTEVPGYTPSGVWSQYTAPTGGIADIQPLTNDTVSVTASHFGVWQFVFRENNSLLTSCYDTDTVQIEFVEIPVISAGPDKDVCGNCTTLEGISAGFEGSWLPNGAEFGDGDDYDNPNADVCVAAYVPTTFTWLESNAAETQSLSCSATDDVVITFWREPTAAILTDLEDSTVCGLTFNNLRAESPGSGITGYWYNINPATVYGDAFDWSTWATVPNYGYHDFYWIEQTGPTLTPGFCNDTAGPLRIRFIQIPNANAGIDTLFCGYCGYLNAIPSVGNGIWTTPSEENITFDDENDPFTRICSNVINTGNPTYPNFLITWTEDNSNGCTDKDTVKVVFARIPSSALDIIPPKCFGEPATIAAAEDSLPQYTWNFYTGLVESDSANINGGVFHNYIYWNSTDTAHRVSMIATNSYGCQSPINVDTVYEPIIPTFDITLIQDTCSLGKGGIVFGDTLGTSAFFWLDPNIGPGVMEPITTVYGLPVGEYGIHTSYLTPNITNYAYYLQIFGTANCIDTFYYEIEPIGMIDAEMSVSAEILLEELVAPNARVVFLNTSDYDDVSKRCEWHFDDGTVVKSCDPMVEHIYTEANCYNPFLIVMNRDLPECRDTAKLETCIFVDDASKIEVPNIFSPNGDGINDFFQVKAQTLRTFNGVITNRWGRTVYEWTDWETYEAGWDGTIGGGSKAAPGVYFYVITAEGMDGNPYEKYGAFHLMRED